MTLDTLIAAHADIAIGDITRAAVRAWVADLSADSAPSTVHNEIGVLRQVLAMAVAENRIVTNPVDGVELPTVTALEQRFLTLEQLHRLADAAGPHRPLVYMLGTTGLRFGEAAELRWRDIDLENRRIRVSRAVTLVDGEFVIGSPKSGKARTASVSEFVADLLEEEIASRSSRKLRHDPGALVFPDSQGGHMRGSNVRLGGGLMRSRRPSCSRARRPRSPERTSWCMTSNC